MSEDTLYKKNSIGCIKPQSNIKITFFKERILGDIKFSTASRPLNKAGGKTNNTIVNRVLIFCFRHCMLTNNLSSPDQTAYW